MQSPLARPRVLRGTLLALAVMLVAAAAGAADGREAGTPSDYLVFVVDADGSVRPVYAARVRLRGELRSIDPAARAAATAASRSHEHVVARLRDTGGATVFESVVRVPRWLRGEFHGDGPGAAGEYTIESHVLPAPVRAFVVRVPVVPRATLELESPLIREASRFDLDALARDPAVAGEAPAPRPPPLQGAGHGNPGNRVDLLFMGDGYSSAQSTKFASDAASLAASFFAISPYGEYRNYVNVSTLFTPSAQPGADQPPYDPSCDESAIAQTCCADLDAFGTTPTSVATAFDATFCSFNIQRLLTVDAIKVFAAAAAEPDWDEILVLVNSPTYGGSGGDLGVLSTNGDAVGVVQHEYGHSFTGLADEYDTPFPGFPACSDVIGGFPPCERNVTDQRARAFIKWARWIAPGQLTPSTSPPPIATDAGLWEGARYLGSGMYRQGYACLMRQLATPFCDVAAETYALRLYEGGWGLPAGGIDNIEPGSESPVPGDLTLPDPGGTFGATVLGPVAGPDLAVEWRLDGTPVASQPAATGTTASYTLATTTGLHTLELHVTDTSPIIHPTVRGSLASSRVWQVTVGQASTLCGDADRNGTVDVIDAANVLRAAVLLPSRCPVAPPLCDVDGNGRIDVIDAANVLRRAVALPSAARCAE